MFIMNSLMVKHPEEEGKEEEEEAKSVAYT
jgi:hypothetical protein